MLNVFYLWQQKRMRALLVAKAGDLPKRLKYARVPIPDKLAEEMPEAVSAGDGAADIEGGLVAGSNIVAAAS